jgi:hypothetical protein
MLMFELREKRMETQFVTLALPKATIDKAEVVAAKRSLSLSALLIEMLQDIVQQADERYLAAQARQVALMRTGLDLRIGDSIPWSREELHERR